jgi:hypothetical protein
MHETTRSRSLSRILGSAEQGDEAQSFSKERQHTAQAFTLHVEYKDGRQLEGFPWSHYGGYYWKDDGERERLVLLFGERALEIEGYNLSILIAEIREGQLNGIKELVSRQATLLESANKENEPVIASVKSYPDFEQILSELKGGEDHGKHGHARRVAGR